MAVWTDCGHESNRDAFASRFASCRQWVLVMTTGIAVRYLEGSIKDKRTDPGIVVIDEGCRFAVSLVGGHEGGANLLAYRVANLTGAVPVVTTATEALKPLVVGLGCRKGIRADDIDAAVRQALLKVSRTQAEIREIATIDLKSEERGILEWCERALRAVKNHSANADPGAAMGHECFCLGAAKKPASMECVNRVPCSRLFADGSFFRKQLRTVLRWRSSRRFRAYEVQRQTSPCLGRPGHWPS